MILKGLEILWYNDIGDRHGFIRKKKKCNERL